MRIFLFVMLFFIGVSVAVESKAQADTTKKIFEKGLDQIKLQKAKHLFYAFDYPGALQAYEELYQTNGDNPLIQYRLGEVHLQLQNYKASAEFIQKALSKEPEIDKDARLIYAEALHRTGNFNEAISQLNIYKSSSIKENKIKKLEEVDRKIKGLNFAIEANSKPYQVTIENMGVDINSAFDDYGPSISADNKTIIFTSRRPESKGGDVDNADGKFYEDIYISTWDEEQNKWSKATGIVGRLNTEYHDACLSISPDGQDIYVYKNFGENGSGEIYVSSLSSSGKWGGPKSLGKTINTSYFESSATITADGEKLYFLSERKGGLGMSDIWMAERISRSEWGEPVNLGGVINTPMDERMVFIHPEGNILFFASDGHIEKSIGGYDIFMSENKDGLWQPPVNIGFPINTVNDDVNFVLSFDAKTAYYSGYKDNSIGEKDIYQIDVTEHELMKKVREMYVTLKGEILDGENNNEALKTKATVTITNADSGKLFKEFKVEEKMYSTKIERGAKYTVEVKASGFSTQTVTIDLMEESKEMTVNQNFTLKR